MDDPFAHLPPLDRSSLETPLVALGLSTRLLNALRSAGLETLAEVMALGPEGIAAVRNVGRASIRELCDRVAELALERSHRTAETYAYLWLPACGDTPQVANAFQRVSEVCNQTPIRELIESFFAAARRFTRSFLAAPLAALGLSRRTSKALESARVHTVADVVRLGATRYLGIREFGVVSA